MIEIKDKSNCCGCCGCANICPGNCISMKEDMEGFLYPEINKNLCIDCGLCEKVCPVLNVLPDEPKEQWGYIVQNRDEKILTESTSGGAFTAIAECVIENGGIVFGAAFDEELNVVHTAVDNKSDLYKFRNSKYVQSDIGSCFKQAKKFLDESRLVCFSGTPCQIEGLYHFLGKEYENLILVDVVCRAVPSPLLWKKYLETKNKDFNNITYVKFRDKKNYGYKYSQLGIYDNNEQIYNSGVESDPYLRAFFSNICDRPSCYNCKFKKRYRISDFTIWDCFDSDIFSKKLDNNKGVTRVLLQSRKSNDLFQKIKNKVYYENVEADILIGNFNEMFNSVEMNSKRIRFFEDLNSMDGKSFFNTYFHDSIKIKIERNIRRVLAKSNYYNRIKKIAKKFLKNNTVLQSRWNK